MNLLKYAVNAISRALNNKSLTGLRQHTWCLTLSHWYKPKNSFANSNTEIEIEIEFFDFVKYNLL